MLAVLWVAVVMPVRPAVAQPPAPPISASGAVVWDPADERALWGEHATTPRPMASTTKIMTVLLALEAGTITDTVRVSANAAAEGPQPGAASLGLRAGDQLSMRSLLAGLMLRSGNDAAVAVAEHVAGSEAAFVQRMNARAAELGLWGTSFINSSGLTDDPAHRSSPVDLARLAHVAMQQPAFREWSGAASLSAPGLGSMDNRNELVGSYDGATGVKTGYTNLAGMCLVASASRGDRAVYAVVLGSQDSFGDAAALLDHGFDAFADVSAYAEGDQATVYRTAARDVPLVAGGALRRTLPVDARVEIHTTLTPRPPDRVDESTVLGEAALIADGEVEARAPLRAARAPAAASPTSAGATVGAAVHDAVRTFMRLDPQVRVLQTGH